MYNSGQHCTRWVGYTEGDALTLKEGVTRQSKVRHAIDKLTRGRVGGFWLSATKGHKSYTSRDPSSKKHRKSRANTPASSMWECLRKFLDRDRLCKCLHGCPWGMGTSNQQHHPRRWKKEHKEAPRALSPVHTQQCLPSMKKTVQSPPEPHLQH